MDTNVRLYSSKTQGCLYYLLKYPTFSLKHQGPYQAWSTLVMSAILTSHGWHVLYKRIQELQMKGYTTV